VLKDWLNTNKRVQDNLLRRKYDVCSRRATVELQPAGATTPSCSYLPVSGSGGEVVALQVDDIDWRAGDIIIRGKDLFHDRMPLPPDVGEALTCYLRRDRPACKTRSAYSCACHA